MYLNGVLDATYGSAVPHDFTSIYDIVIGYEPISNIEPWKGAIDDFKLYDGALTDAEILEEYNASKGNYFLFLFYYFSKILIFNIK